MKRRNTCSLQVFVPNEVKVFGSAHYQANFVAKMALDCKGPKEQILNIKKSHMKALDQPHHRCYSDSKPINTSACIADFIEREIGCNPNIQGSQYSTEQTCTFKPQLLQLQNISHRLSESYDNEIYAMTGCLSSCEKDLYIIDAEPMTCERGIVDEYVLTLRITDRSYEERKQYIIYETNSFIADVGGYMGLLLGCSIWSLINEIEAFVKKLIIKPLCGIKKNNWVKK